MDAALAAMPIIDVDTHFTEPPDLWTSRAPAKLKELAPRVERDRDGHEQWVVDRNLVLGPVGYCVIRRDGSKAYGRVSLDTFAELHPGASQAAPRMRFMDEHGLTMQVLYPNILGFTGSFIMRVDDAELRAFCIQAYNDGVAELQAESGRRLLPQALLPIWDVELAVKELVRCHEKLGLTGLVLTDSPELWNLPTLSEPYWEPLWSTAQERGLPVNFHIGGGGAPGALWAGMSPAAWIAAMSSLSDVGNMRTIVNLIFSGLLDRFPRLNFVSVESGGGWLTFLIELAEYQLDENGVTGLALRPREYFRRQIYASYWFESDVKTAIDKLGEDNIMFETDFPHPTCLYPSIREQVQKTLGGLDARIQQKVLYATAARVYQLEVPGAA